MNHFHVSLLVLGTLVMTGCGGKKLTISSVGYQAVRTSHYHTQEQIPRSAKIIMIYYVSADGQIGGIVKNNTDKVMTIDQTKTFFVNSDGTSTSYYDPTVRTQTVTDMSSSTSGASVNLGGVGRMLGVGGKLGGLLSAINVGGSGTSGQAVANTTYMADLPQVSIGPHGSAVLSKTYSVSGIGYYALAEAQPGTIDCTDRSNSPVKFSISVSYSLDDGDTFDLITTDFFLSSQIVVPVGNLGEVNEKLRSIYSLKPDAINEPSWNIAVSSNIYSGNDRYGQSLLVDFQ